MHLIAREGYAFDVNDDPFIEEQRTVDLITSTGSFNDNGQFAFNLSFTDGTSGIFVADLNTTLLGDITGDGFVGAEDLDILIANWGDMVGARAASSGDLSGDGVVGQADLNIVLGAWGDGNPPDVNVPEPGTLALFGIGLLAWGRKKGISTNAMNLGSNCF